LGNWSIVTQLDNKSSTFGTQAQHHEPVLSQNSPFHVFAIVSLLFLNIITSEFRFSWEIPIR
jgi:hypothetical protein